MRILLRIQSAGHAVLRTLYSRAQRIGLNGISCLLRSLFQSVSLNGLVIVASYARLCVCPEFELVGFLKYKLQRFRNDVGWIRIKELGAPVQIASDFFLHANLQF